jgi:hypothetical protein
MKLIYVVLKHSNLVICLKNNGHVRSSVANKLKARGNKFSYNEAVRNDTSLSRLCDGVSRTRYLQHPPHQALTLENEIIVT